MLKRIEIGIAGKGLEAGSFRYIKQLAARFQIKGVVFTKHDGSIKVIADGEEDEDLEEFVKQIEESGIFSTMENFYAKWEEPQEKIQETF